MLRSIAILALLVGACADPATAQSGPLTCSAPSTQSYEAGMQDVLSASGHANVGVLLERDDGRRAWLTAGAPNARYISSSTAKPVMTAVILDLVASGTLSLRTRAIDVLPAWRASAVGQQRTVELRHLLAMTSGMVQGPACWQSTTPAAFAACVDGMPAANTEREPGATFHYSTHHLDIASHVAATVTGQTWEALVDDWRGRMGLFPGLTWNTSMVRAGGSHLNITAAEYLDFLNALDQCAILPPRLCAMMQQDQHPIATTRNSLQFYALRPDGTQLREDWRFGWGLWLECAAEDWSCPYTHRVSSYGSAGQYAAIDRAAGYRIVVTPAFGGHAGLRGLLLARDLAPLAERWAAIGRL